MYNKVKESAEYISERISIHPATGIILGSGLGGLTDQMEDAVSLPYSEIPHFPESTVKGHAGDLLTGRIDRTEVMAMRGRFHFYEGFSFQEIVYPLYVMKELGITRLIVTNACGGINIDFAPGDLMLINDFINFMPGNPLFGSNDERFGPRFPDMTEPYSLSWIEKAKKIAGELDIPFREGVYAGFSGPCYETKAEIKMMGILGADAVGMSTVPETIAANYLGMMVLGIACITNMATGIQRVKHSHERVLETARKSSEMFCRWLNHIISAG